MDVDAGPVIAGFGVSACSFGMGAARANNRFDHAYPLGTEVLAGSWPLLDGTLLTARYLSNAAHAKYVGEACLLFSFTRMPQDKPVVSNGGHLPAIVYLMLAFYPLAGLVLVAATMQSLKKWRKTTSKQSFRFERIQVIVWVTLIIAGIVVTISVGLLLGLLPILGAQFLPRFAKKIAVCADERAGATPGITGG
jgi:hypothetical protein